MRRDHRSLTAGQPVLASAQLPDPVPVDIPPPDVDIDRTYQADESQQDEGTWAVKGINNAESVESTKPQQDGLEPTKANLLYESDSVVATEDKAALDEYDVYYLFADKDMDAHICDVLNYADTLISASTFNPNDPSQVADALLSLKSSDGPYAPGVVASALKNTYMLFQQAFPQCNSIIESIQWIIEQLHKLFCPSG
ncbi:MAG TPA: hypothetical protein VIY52_08735 [Streptosporangiaceae bacterium]